MSKFRALGVFFVICLSIYVLFTIPINKGLDLQGGMYLILEAQDTDKLTVDDDAVIGAMTVIRNRIDSLGLTEPVLRRKGTRQISIELPGIDDPQRAMNLIGDTALLEFVEGEWAPGTRETLTEDKLKILGGEKKKLEFLVEKDAKGVVVRETPILLGETVITGADLKGAYPGTDQYGEPIVQIEFNEAGSDKFYRITQRNIGKPLAILLDGRIISAPNIREPISGGKAQISGSFSIQEMRDLVIQLKAGALPVPITIISNKVVGPTLGQDSVEKSTKASLIGVLLVCLYIMVMYKLPGVLACLALVCYVLISFACLKLLNATLTLPGIAGLILTVGMAVDANVIIFERIKEEFSKTESVIESITNGFNQGFSTIVDANITTLVAASVLFWLGTGPIKGFAVTLTIGILVSMFTAIVITRLFMVGIANFALRHNKRLFRMR